MYTIHVDKPTFKNYCVYNYITTTICAMIYTSTCTCTLCDLYVHVHVHVYVITHTHSISATLYFIYTTMFH